MNIAELVGDNEIRIIGPSRQFPYPEAVDTVNTSNNLSTMATFPSHGQSTPCMTTESKSVTIYTDGACLGNPGPGGYAVVLLYGWHRKELSGAYRQTTNNRMEIMAAIVGLQALKHRCRIKLHTDSKYLQQSISLGWAQRWRANGWKKKDGRRLNWDLWERLLDACAQHDVEFLWVRGHAGHTENERCDFLSTQAAQGTDLQVDVLYEDPLPAPQKLAPPSLFDFGPE